MQRTWLSQVDCQGIYKNALRIMNVARLQDTMSIHRKQLHFYILTMNNWKTKLKKKFFTIYSLKWNVRYKYRRSICWKLLNTDERHQRPKSMGRHTMFMNQKIHVSSPPNWLIDLAQFQLKLQDFVVDTDKLILKIYMGRQRNWITKIIF